MTSSEFRAEARNKLSGKWGKAALMTLAYMFFFFILGFINGLFKEGSLLYLLIQIATLIIEIPLFLGLTISFLKLYNDEEVKAFDFISMGFNNFARSWGIAWHTFLKMIVPYIIMVVLIILMFVTLGFSFVAATSSNFESLVTSLGAFAIIFFIAFIAISIWLTCLGLYYSIAYIVAADNPEISSKEAVEKSKELMTGNRSQLFILQLSFIGWAILATFTFGIGYLWLIPYIQFATIAFYKHLNGNNSSPINSTPIEDNSIQQ